MIVEIDNLHKSFKDVKAVDDISFRVKEGELFAFLGVNGAGKSTTINIISGVLAKDSGKVIVCGENIDNNLDKIIIEDENDFETIKSILEEIDSKIKLEIDSEILQKYSLEKQLKATENKKVWLKSGAFITIDKTEALIAVDVNSGKFIGKNDAEETITSVNIEAAREIAKQIRLRDISGIIVIDFIDMHKEENKKAVIQEIVKCSKKDRSKVQVEEFTKLNLMEITRKHINSKKKFDKWT